MALPIAHFSVALGSTKSKDPLALCLLCLISILPDFDLALVFGFGLPLELYHRTWSHSLFFAFVLSLLWLLFRPKALKAVSPVLFFAVLASHGLVDLLCTLDPSDHGIELFWPFSDVRLGWPVLVPIYLLWADSAFTISGVIRFTLLEIVLAGPLWFLTVQTRRWISMAGRRTLPTGLQRLLELE